MQCYKGEKQSQLRKQKENTLNPVSSEEDWGEGFSSESEQGIGTSGYTVVKGLQVKSVRQPFSE